MKIGTRWKITCGGIATWMLPQVCCAQETVIGPPTPHEVRWVGVMLLVIAGWFLMAAVIGPIVRANLPDESPDDPPAHP